MAVDPEMLGRIFEELVLTGEDTESGGKSRRHDTGSHYTPRPVVRYLCRDSLAAWLADRKPFSLRPEPRASVDALLALDASVGLDDATWTTLRELLTSEEARTAVDMLFDLRACDPAVGSGAFPLGLLHELLNLARLLEARARGKDPAETEDQDWLYDNKKRLIERCLYGVDVQEEALEICKLRLWLSMMVDHQLGVVPDQCDRRSFASALKKLEPLPNLEFKIRRADALVDKIRGHRLFIDRPRQDDRVRVVIGRLRDAKHGFYNAQTAAKKRRFRFAIYQAIAELAQHELSWMKRHHGLGLDDSDEIRASLVELQRAEHALGEVRRQLDSARKFKKAAAQEDALERLRLWWDDPDAPTFVWHFDFAEVFHRVPRVNRETDLLIEEEEGAYGHENPFAGFDQMIGNPPYVRIQVLKRTAPEDVDWYRQHYVAAQKGNYDLYVVFIERALTLLHRRGQLAFICPHKFFNADYGEPLRELIASGQHLRHVVHFGDEQIFPGATNYVCLLFLARAGAQSCRFVRADDLPKWLAAFAGIEGSVPKQSITLSNWNFVVGKGADLFAHLERVREKLRSATSIFVGLQTSADKIFIIEDRAGGRTDMLEFEAHDGTMWTVERTFLKHFVSDIPAGPFGEPTSHHLLIFPYAVQEGAASLVEEKELKSRSPKLWAYLRHFETSLRERESGKANCPEWYGYIYRKNLTLFDAPKLIVQVIAQAPRFAYDSRQFYFTGGGNGPYYGVRWNKGEKRSLEFLQAILNSRIAGFYIRQVSTPFRGGYWSFGKRFIEQIPIPRSDRSQEQTIELMVKHLRFLSLQPSVQAAILEHPRDPQVAGWFERWVNALVYELFFPEELRARGLSFFGLTEDFAPPPPALDADPAATLRAARAGVERLSAPGHTLRRALDQLQTLDLVRTIEGA